ncbi:nickel ABC transporter ATP-binding protein NikE [Azospirillum halopraeferens]|uniref:nickel ABC transporter ATP-binding protein NikE n=1 Tax=Azospirillum halopraeferens TaxID=34010 RepID=UPI000409B6DB|nr:nickel ABC transporter ATP-binding protein NikE [Azospirillum halopraeferens]
MILLAAEGVAKTYRPAGLFGGPPPRRVLDDVTLTVGEGEGVALVGASGSGKSTLARLLPGLEPAGEGRVLFRGAPVAGLRGADLRAYRRAVQVVFQDPFGAVNPRHRVGRIISEPLRHLTDLSPAGRADRVAELLTLVGLAPEDAGKLPGQMSGGQVQRVCIARALAPEPALIILDEAVSNLDLVMQIRILDMLAALRRPLGTAFLFVTHDLRLVPRLCERVVVLDGGRVVEERPVTSGHGFTHPAARRLWDAVLPAMPVRAGAERAAG